MIDAEVRMAEQLPINPGRRWWRAVRITLAVILVFVASHLSAQFAWAPAWSGADGSLIPVKPHELAIVDRMVVGYLGAGEWALLILVVLLATATNKDMTSHVWDFGAVAAGALLLLLRGWFIAIPDLVQALIGMTVPGCTTFLERTDVAIVQGPVLVLGLGLVVCGVLAGRLSWWLRLAIPLAGAVVTAVAMTLWIPLPATYWS